MEESMRGGNRNMWGEGYKIVTKWIRRSMKDIACGESIMEEVRKLFPEQGCLEWKERKKERISGGNE